MNALWWILAGVALTLVAAATAIAIGSLRWWVGAVSLGSFEELGPGSRTGGDRRRFVVYIEGIDAYSRNWISDREGELLAALAAQRPDLRLIRDLFLYDPGSPDLASTRSGWLWRYLHRFRRRGGVPGAFSRLNNVRNYLEVCVAADPRYGPIFSRNVGSRIGRALLAHGYEPVRDGHVVLLGFSGGAQLGLAAIPHLCQAMGVEVSLVTLGGFFAAETGIQQVHRLVEVYGRRDLVRGLGVLICPSRWRVAGASQWNLARRAGKIIEVDLGERSHTGKNGYLANRRYLAETADALANAIDSVEVDTVFGPASSVPRQNYVS